jgi:hypothetical protein
MNASINTSYRNKASSGVPCHWERADEELDSGHAAGGGRAGSWKWVQGETGQVSPCRLFFGEHKASEGRQVQVA